MASDHKHNRSSVGVIYEIYPATFCDSNNPNKDPKYSGHGDLKGIISKLDYIKSFNVDAIWISPIFLSPEGAAGDGGYAITKYDKIDPRFGSMEDFEHLLKAAHDKDLRVFTDFVPCHTANNHEWFEKSRNPKDPEFEKYKDYYVWHEGYKENGKLVLRDGHPVPPNNWMSVFKKPGTDNESMPAWEWDNTRKMFYLHHFNTSQPSLNLNNENVQHDILKEMDFWLNKGVDGLRIDALPFANYHKDFFADYDKPNEYFAKAVEEAKKAGKKINGRDLTANDIRIKNNSGKWSGPDHQWDAQDFDCSMCQPQTIEFIGKVRKLMDSHHPPKIGLGEVVTGPWGGGGSMEQAAKYLDPKTGLHTAYTQELVQFYDHYPPADVLRDVIKKNVGLSPDGGFCNNLGNHDFPRFATRMTKNAPYDKHETIIRQLMSLAVTLPGSLCLYQGEELGLTQADVPHDKRKDLVAKENRDGCRTPMPWNSMKKNAGFSELDTPYLPVPDGHYALAVDKLESQPKSMLHYTRHILQQRKENPALNKGKTIVLDMPGSPIVAFVRQTSKQTVLCAFNMSGNKASFKPADFLDWQIASKLDIPDGEIHLDPYTSSFNGLYPPKKGAEWGLCPAPAPQQNGNGHVRNGTTRVFAADMLIADHHVDEDQVPNFLHAFKKHDPKFTDGSKATIDKAQYEAFLKESNGARKISPGGGTACSLWMLKKLLGNKVDISLMGLAGDDEYGKTTKDFLKNAGIHLVTEEWPAGVPQETAVSPVIRHKSGKDSVLTYPGTETQALSKLLEQNPDLLENSVKKSDIVYLPESTVSKFGVTFFNELLRLRGKYNKELVIALPSRAHFGPDDSERIRFLLPSCNVVMGNDVEFCRVLDKETTRPVSAEQMGRVIKVIQAKFNEHYEGKEKMACSPYGQVAFITRGNKDEALIVTKNRVIPIKVFQAKKHTMLGAGYATFAGFLDGYIQRIPHESSATLAMALGAEKVQQPDSNPFLNNPEISKKKVLLRGGAMRKVASDLKALEAEDELEHHQPSLSR